MQRKLWKKVIKRAWYHDRNFCNCTPLDIGLGMIPVVSIIPIIGPIMAYYMHGKMSKLVIQAGGPPSLVAKMAGNIATDFLISLMPVLGTIFSWMFGASTCNAALFDTWLRKSVAKSNGSHSSPQVQQATMKTDLDRRKMQGNDTPTPPQTAAARSQPPANYAPASPYRQGIPSTSRAQHPIPAYIRPSPPSSNQFVSRQSPYVPASSFQETPFKPPRSPPNPPPHHQQHNYYNSHPNRPQPPASPYNPEMTRPHNTQPRFQASSPYSVQPYPTQVSHPTSRERYNHVHRRPVPNMPSYPAPNSLEMPSPPEDITYHGNGTNPFPDA